MQEFLIGLFFVVVIPLIIAFNIYSYKHSRLQLTNWATQNQLTLNRATLCFFWYGPFFFRSNRGHLVYRIAITDSANRARTGYARVGTWWLGAFGNQVAIAWDDQTGQIQLT